jgi:hypothetical protein
MEKLNPKNSVRINGYIVSVQSQDMPPVQSYVKEASEIGSIVSSVLSTRPGAIVLISSSVIL